MWERFADAQQLGELYPVWKRHPCLADEILRQKFDIIFRHQIILRWWWLSITENLGVKYQIQDEITDAMLSGAAKDHSYSVGTTDSELSRRK